MTFRDMLNSAEWASSPTDFWGSTDMSVLVVDPQKMKMLKGTIVHSNGESVTVLFPNGTEKYYGNYDIRHVYEFYILPEDD